MFQNLSINFMLALMLFCIQHLIEQINELFEKTTKQKKQFEYKKRRAAMALEDVQAQRAQLAREQEQERRRLAVLETQVNKKQGEVCVFVRLLVIFDLHSADLNVLLVICRFPN